MKKLFTVGLLALAISASAEAKNVVKLKTIKKEKSKKGSLKFQEADCRGGMTECGTPYMYCGADQGTTTDLQLYDWESFWACEI